MDVKGNSGEDSEDRRSKKAFYPLREHTYHRQHNVLRNMNVKGASGEVSDENEGHVFGP